MAMSNYSEISTKVEEWLNREGFTSLTDQVEDLMAIAQRRIARYDFNCMVEVDTAFTIDAQSESVPYELLRVRSLTISQSNNNYEVQGAPDQQVLRNGTPSRPLYFTIMGDDFYFGPAPDQAYTATLVYYKPEPLISTSNATNWFSTNAPELILFGALLEASLFLKDDARAQVWEARFKQLKDDILAAEDRADKPGGALQVRTM